MGTQGTLESPRESAATAKSQMELDFPEVFELPEADNRARLQQPEDEEQGGVPPYAYLLGLVTLLAGGVVNQNEAEQALAEFGIADVDLSASQQVPAMLNGPLTCMVGGTPNVICDSFLCGQTSSAITAGVMDAVRRESQMVTHMIGQVLGGSAGEIVQDNIDWDDFLCSFSFA